MPTMGMFGPAARRRAARIGGRCATWMNAFLTHSSSMSRLGARLDIVGADVDRDEGDRPAVLAEERDRVAHLRAWWS